MSTEVPEATLGDIGQLSPESLRNLAVAGQLNSERWRNDNSNTRGDNEQERESKCCSLTNLQTCCSSCLWKKVGGGDNDENETLEGGSGSSGNRRVEEIPVGDGGGASQMNWFAESQFGKCSIPFLKRLMFVLALSVGFWLCVLGNDIIRTFFASINILIVANGGEGSTVYRNVFGVELEPIEPPENLDFFSEVQVPNTTATVVVLNEFLVGVQNFNVFTFVVTASLFCVGFAVYGLWACGPCTEEVWREALDCADEETDCYAIGCCGAMCVIFVGTIVMVWFFPPDVVGFYEFDEWLYVPGNLDLANQLGYAGIIVISSPCWIAIVLCLMAVLIVVCVAVYDSCFKQSRRGHFGSREGRRAYIEP